MPDLQISVWPWSSWPIPDLIGVAREAEQAGYDGLWLADHFMPNTGTEERSDGGMYECFTLLAGLATAVDRIRLGSLVAGMTYRHPAVLANMATTIDHLSGGRFVLGVGAGWQINEHAAYGIELGSIRERIDRFVEGVTVLRDLLSLPRTDVDGQYYRVTDAPMEPKPIQRPLPLMIGASGEKRMLGVVAETADEWNIWSTPDVFAAKSAVLDEHCARIGRDPATIRRSTQAMVTLDELPDPSGRATIGGSIDAVVDAVGQWRQAGLTEWIIPAWGTPGQARELFGRIMTDVVPQLG